MKTIGQLQAELKKLGAQAQGTLYKRLGIADTLLKSDEFLAQFQGKLDAAEAYLEKDGFPEIQGWYTLGELMSLYRDFDKQTWEEYRYNPKALHALRDEQRQSDEGPKRESWKSIAEDRGEELTTANRQLETANALLDHEQSENAQLKLRIAQLERENAELRGRISELERFAKMVPASV